MVVHRKERAKTKGRKKIKEAFHEQITVTIRPPVLPEPTAQRWPERMRAAKLSYNTHLHRAQARGGRLQVVVRTMQALRVTNKGTVEVGRDLDSKLAGKDCVLMPLLAAYHALAACRKGG
jgi:hypothetical protein